jgi:hypothetical protein
MEGQLIMFVVILAFFAMFLLREWIMQNTPAADLPVNDVLDVPANVPRAEPRVGPNRLATDATVLEAMSSSSSESESDDDQQVRTRDKPDHHHLNANASGSHHDGIDRSEVDDENNGLPNAVDIQWHAPDDERPNAANRVQQVEANPARQALLARQLQANQQPRNNDDDFEFDNAVDDLDGVLEAIGLRGNLWPLGQHAALMILLIAGCLGSAVWTPYIIGKAFILVRSQCVQ